MASIQHRQRANGTVAHRVMFREKPGGTVVSETFDTPEQADYFKALVERIGGAAARAKRGRAEARAVPTLDEALEDYIAQAPDVTRGTAAEYRRVLARSGIDTGLPVHLLDRADIESWVATRARTASKKTKRPPAPKTIRNEHGLISTILAHAEARGWVRTNVAKGVRLPAKTHAELELLTDQEFLALHAAITDRYKPLVWLLGATGLRWGEATALTWRDVGPDWIAVRQAWKHDERHGRILGAPKTRRASRRIVTTPAVIAMLGEGGGADEFVFTNARGGSVKHSTFWESHWKPACTAVGLSPVPKIHSLRHWAASYMLAQGADLFEVSRALGHADISTTSNVYGHLVPSRTRPTETHAARLEELQRTLTA